MIDNTIPREEAIKILKEIREGMTKDRKILQEIGATDKNFDFELFRRVELKLQRAETVYGIISP